MINRFLFIIFIVIFGNGLHAQEFLCNVKIQHQQIQGVDNNVFDALEKSVFEFINNRKWSDYNFQLEERLECTMILTINQANQGGSEFSGTLNLVLQRPVYGTDYNSVIINLVDNDLQFEYTPYQAMEYSDNTYSDNLTQILAFYAYMMLGLDFDTFSPLGGTVFFEKANAVVAVAQNSKYQGWQIFEGPKNRAQFAENVLNSSYQSLRQMMYEYHRKGLDAMSDKIETGRQAITASLDNLKSVYEKRPNLYYLQIILEAKRQEIIDIYSEATPAEKVSMLNIMKEVDPPYGSRYDAVMK
jgi:hypothetical protein